MTVDFSPSRPCRVSDIPQWDMEADIVVVGFGAAGASAAIEARLAGARTLVFEVAAGGGGSAALSGGEIYLGGNGGTPVQRAAGFEDTTEDFRRYLMLAGGPAADAARVDLYAEQAVAHYHWLVAQGVPFKGTYLPGKWLEPTTDDTLVYSGSEAAWPFAQQARPCPRGHAAQLAGWGAGKKLMQCLMDRALSLGADVHYSARALTLVVDDHRQVLGLVVRIDGAPRFVRALGGVILCSGGFISNEAMVRQYAPAALACSVHTSAGNDDGSGIRMGLAVGAATIQMEQFFSTMPNMPPDSLVKGIFVNEAGQRFINEDAYHGRVTHFILRQSNSRAWLLLDNSTFARPLTNQDVEVHAVGESWEEVEGELELPAGSLTHTVQAYNDCAAQGQDPWFHKAPEWLQPLTEAPFAALSYSPADFPAAAFTLGGLSTAPTGQVLNGDGDIVPGLYAAGRAACGLPRWGDSYSSGLSLGDSTFFGRQAALHAAGTIAS
ncbi:MAG: FAD-dependent oxidoreductase [Halioglobus sp.]|nr:FAD-dependent oxidoreductase [Halioglobus sp.]